MGSAPSSLIEKLYADEGIAVDKFLYDVLWQRDRSRTVGRFQATDSNVYQFVKDSEGLELFQELDQS